jgi:DNA mismatch endonuclease (patch repair protein)
VTDVVSAEKRSEMMSGIRGKNTRPELLVRKALFAKGYRFRLHRKDLPGSPDIVLPRWHVAILVHGCFWHGHRDCRYAKTPSTRTGFWAEKLEANRQRDQRDVDSLRAAGWRTLVIWECFLRSPLRANLADALHTWIKGSQQMAEWREPARTGNAEATTHRTSDKKTSST